jgi:hypothetical protein
LDAQAAQADRSPEPEGTLPPEVQEAVTVLDPVENIYDSLGNLIFYSGPPRFNADGNQIQDTDFEALRVAFLRGDFSFCSAGGGKYQTICDIEKAKQESIQKQATQNLNMEAEPGVVQADPRTPEERQQILSDYKGDGCESLGFVAYDPTAGINQRFFSRSECTALGGIWYGDGTCQKRKPDGSPDYASWSSSCA